MGLVNQERKAVAI